MYSMFLRIIWHFTILLLLSLCFFSAQPVFADTAFQKWISDFYATAAKKGVSRTVYDKAFAGVTMPDEKVLESARYQPEFTLQLWDYLDSRVNQLSVSRGKAMREKYRTTLATIEKTYGLPSGIILAIWSMETNYGAVLKRPKRLYYIPRALATLAYADKRRARFARKQLVAALQILQAGDIQGRAFLGSWAGAMGHTQFIPTSYLAYGVDLDRDGRRDIWHSVPDALASSANLLSKNKWQKGKTWGYAVTVPKAFSSQHVDATKTLAQWKKLGYERSNGKPFPRLQDNAVLKVPGGKQGPAFLVIKNFFVIKKYNNSDFYALAVGLLADQISGYSEVVQDWPRPKHALLAKEKYELQRHLYRLGYYADEIDGKIGSRTLAAIRLFQKREGLPVEGKVNKQLLLQLQGKK